jgi:Probable cobalt transporter subunit (CbtA)
MVGRLLLRGMIVGLFAGLIAFGFAKVWGEPSVDWAIAFEAQVDAAKEAHGSGVTVMGPMSTPTTGAASAEATLPVAGAHDHGDDGEIFSRWVQAGPGLATGILVLGVAFGGIFSLVFAFAYGRMGKLGPRGTAAVLAVLGFIAVILVPQLKYPANPPSVGNPDTIVLRTQLYFGMIAVSVLGMVVAVWLSQRLRPVFGVWNAAIISGAALVLGLGVVMYALPVVNEVPDGFSATIMWQFRMATWGIFAILMAGIGLGFGAVAEPLLIGKSQRVTGRFATN